MSGKNNLIILSVIIAVLGLAYLWPVLIPLRESFFIYTQKIWWVVLLGLFIGGVADYFVPKTYISQALAAHRKRTILYSVGLGSLMSVCSHGILAISMELYKKGASTSAVIAFLLASPWANFPFTLLIIGLFGLSKAVFIICSAVLIAIVTGLIFQVLEKLNLVEKNPNTEMLPPDHSMLKDFKNRMRQYSFSMAQFKKDVRGITQGMVSLSDMVLGWVLIGTLLASLSAAYVPQAIFKNYMGPTVGGLLVTLVLATVIEVCSEGTTPLAFELYKQTGALGNSFVFLMAGVVTDYTEIGLIWHNIGKKTALWLPLITVPQVMALGALANWYFFPFIFSG